MRPRVEVARHSFRPGSIQSCDKIGAQKLTREIVEIAIGRFPGASRLENRIGQKRVARSRFSGKATQQSRIQRE